MTLQEVCDYMAARNPHFRAPSAEHIAHMQQQIDDAARQLAPTKAAELHRLWHGHDRPAAA